MMRPMRYYMPDEFQVSPTGAFPRSEISAIRSSGGGALALIVMAARRR